MKVIIVGAGLSGLSTALALRKFIPANQQLEVKIYDNTDLNQEKGTPKVQTSRLGAGLGLQSNGLRVLEHLGPELKQRVYAAGFPCKRFTWKTAGSWLLGHEYLDVLPISRPLLITCLQETLPPGSVIYKKVARVITHQGKRPVVQFKDGSPDETADLVVGADGIRSTVRRNLFGDEYRPHYVGVCAVGGVLDVPLPQHLLDNPSMLFYVGSTGSFGYTGLTQSDKNKLLYWSVYETDLPGRDLKLNHELMIKQLRDRHGDWADPLIHQCLEKANLDNIYPIFVMPDLPYWGRDGCVIIGDAAHALPPRSGQGASQAFEDGEVLALLLGNYLEKGHDPGDAISRSITGLFQVRGGRVKEIRADALRWKDPKMPMSWLKTCGLYISLFILVRVKRVINFFSSKESWDAREEVSKYLETSEGH